MNLFFKNLIFFLTVCFGRKPGHLFFRVSRFLDLAACILLVSVNLFFFFFFVFFFFSFYFFFIFFLFVVDFVIH